MSQTHITLGDYFTESHKDQVFKLGTVVSGCKKVPILLLEHSLGISYLRFATSIQPYSFKILPGNEIYERTAYFFDLTSSDFFKVVSYSLFFQEEDRVSAPSFPLPQAIQKANSSKRLRIAIVTDMDDSEASQPTISDLSKLDADDYSIIFHLGNFAYNIQDDGGKKGDKFFEKISKSFSQKIPYIVVAGNHEMQKKTDFGKMMMYRFKMPGTEEIIEDNSLKIHKFYSAFIVNGVQFITINFDFVYGVDYSKEKEIQVLYWLRDTLQYSKMRTDVKWRVFMSHRPIYCSDFRERVDDCSSNFWYFRKFEALLLKFKVDIILSGHLHFYSRSQPFKNWESGQSNSKSSIGKPIHIITGRAGNAYYLPEEGIEEDFKKVSFIETVSISTSNSF